MFTLILLRNMCESVNMRTQFNCTERNFKHTHRFYKISSYISLSHTHIQVLYNIFILLSLIYRSYTVSSYISLSLIHTESLDTEMSKKKQKINQKKKKRKVERK